MTKKNNNNIFTYFEDTIGAKITLTKQKYIVNIL